MICRHEELFLVPGIIGERSQSKGGRDAKIDLLLPKIGARADPRLYRFHLGKGFLTALIWKDDDILVPSVPNDTILRAKMQMDDLCDFLQDLRTKQMPMLVHNLLEVVHIKEDQGQFVYWADAGLKHRSIYWCRKRVF